MPEEGAQGLVLPLTPRFFFLGFSESTKETLHQLLVGKRQRPAAELCAPFRVWLTSHCLIGSAIQGQGKGSAFSSILGFLTTFGTKKPSLPL